MSIPVTIDMSVEVSPFAKSVQVSPFAKTPLFVEVSLSLSVQVRFHPLAENPCCWSEGTMDRAGVWHKL